MPRVMADNKAAVTGAEVKLGVMSVIDRLALVKMWMSNVFRGVGGGGVCENRRS